MISEQPPGHGLPGRFPLPVADTGSLHQGRRGVGKDTGRDARDAQPVPSLPPPPLLDWTCAGGVRAFIPLRHFAKERPPLCRAVKTSLVLYLSALLSSPCQQGQRLRRPQSCSHCGRRSMFYILSSQQAQQLSSGSQVSLFSDAQ